jgi:phosphomannomutase
MVSHLVTGTLLAMGIDVIDLGLATTPTVEVMVVEEKADGGIIITASHNPGNWNALKLLNEQGEFISADRGHELLKLSETGDYEYESANQLGAYRKRDDHHQIHIDKILNLDLVDQEAIQRAGFHVVVDCVNSVGGLVLPEFLKKLGVSKLTELYCEPTGLFPHNPEPLPENLEAISAEVVKQHAHLGFVVDPDVDRLAIVCEDGSMFGEEYTLVAAADYVLSRRKGNAVSNLSSTRALMDITHKHGGHYTASAVGEVNVVETMKKTSAVIGGEGNGGVILPELHYGRDALAGIALFLSHLATSGLSCKELRKTYPDYFISKNKVELSAGIDMQKISSEIRSKYPGFPVNELDGIRVDHQDGWVHLRRSNTEPVIRIYSENRTPEMAAEWASKFIKILNTLSPD